MQLVRCFALIILSTSLYSGLAQANGQNIMLDSSDVDSTAFNSIPVLTSDGLKKSKKGFIKKLKIGQSSDNTYTKGEPAQFVGTFPENTNDSIRDNYKVNAYLDIEFINWKRLSVSGQAEWQKNTIISKEQDVVQFGVGLGYQVILSKFQNSASSDRITVTTIDPNVVVYPTLSVKSNNDRVKDKRGIVGSFGLSTRFFKEWDHLDFLRPGNYSPGMGENGFDWIQIKHTHNIGIDYLEVGEDNLYMANASFNLEVNPFNGFFKRILGFYGFLQLKYAIEHREKLNSSEIEAGSLITKGIAFSYRFDEDGGNTITIGYDKIDGANPMKGLEKQEYGQIAFKLKVSI